MISKTLDVFCKGRQVGTLAEEKNGSVVFAYSDGWLREGFPISPFFLPLKAGVQTPRSQFARSYGLSGIFADSLPDAWGRLLLDRYLKSIGITDISRLDRLAYVGSSGMGALEYYPEHRADYSVSGLDYDEIAASCGKVLAEKPVEDLDLLFRLGGSSGGTRPKILLEEDGRHWIVKFPAANDPLGSGKREYEYSLCARDCGIIMTETQLIPSKVCSGYFKTERFDRTAGGKVFTATAAGLLEVDFRAPSCDYSSYMKLISILTKENKEQLLQMYRVMCFNVLAHNRDDHAKNFSFLYDDAAGWRLAPAYDLTYSNTYFGEQTTSVNGKGKNITDSDLIAVGTQAGLRKKLCTEVLAEIREKVQKLR